MSARDTQSQGWKQEVENRLLRGQYRELHTDAIRNDDDVVDIRKDKLAQLISQANVLHGRVQRPREQAVDSEVFAHLTDRGVEQVKRLGHGSAGHTVKDFLRRLKARYARETNDGDGMIDADDFDWAALGKSVAWHFRTAPSVYCMLGPLDARAKTRAQQQRAPRQRLADEVRPVDVQDLAADEQQPETVENAKEMWEALSRQCPAPMLEVVMNHGSFAQTIENLFALSFLVKEGKVGIDMGSQGVGWQVRRVEDAAAANTAAADQERTQFVVSADREEWKRWQRHVQPKDCLMKDRGGEAGGSKGVGRAAKSRPADKRKAATGARGPNSSCQGGRPATSGDSGLKRSRQA